MVHLIESLTMDSRLQFGWYFHIRDGVDVWSRLVASRYIGTLPAQHTLYIMVRVQGVRLRV